MKKRNIIIIVFILLTVLCITFFSRVYIFLSNKTGLDLKNIKISEKMIGDLKSGKTTIVMFKKIWFDTGLPDERISATYNGHEITNDNRGYDCGTQKYESSWGIYSVEILLDTMRDSNDSLVLSLEKN